MTCQSNSICFSFNLINENQLCILVLRQIKVNSGIFFNYYVASMVLPYPNDPQKLTGCQSTNHFIQIALMPKQAGLMWTFFKQNNSLGPVGIQ